MASSYKGQMNKGVGFHNHMAATLAVSDLFDSRKDRIFLTASNLEESIVRRNGGRRISLALTLPFGGAEPGKQKPPMPAQEEDSQKE